MPALDRRISLRGPRFWRDGRVLMFANQFDASTRDGPRLATDADRAAWPDAYAAAGVESDDPPGGRLLTAHDAGDATPPPRPYAARREKAR